MDGSDWFVLGVDPAPSKKTVAFDGTKFLHWEAADVRQKLHEVVSAKTTAGQPVLVLWDAPLCMDEGNFYSREVDRSAQSIVDGWKKNGVVAGSGEKERSAVGIAAAAQCPHNILSMNVLGLPMGGPPSERGLRLLTDRRALDANSGAWVAEVHPAVAIGAWYKHHELGKHHEPPKLPRYKQNKGKSRDVLAALLDGVDELRNLVSGPLLSELLSNKKYGDDELDAFVAWALGKLLLAKKAELWRGLGPDEHATRGYYVMPSAALSTTLSRM